MSEVVKQIKSTVTCDMEGRIETYNKGAHEIFGYEAEEVIGKARVSLFSPGLTVLEHVPTWLKIAREQGEYKGTTVFVRKDGTRFAADVRITPTWDGDTQIGYCGVTTPRPDLPLEQAAQPVSLFTRLFAGMVVARAPFLTASIMPVLIGAAWVAVNLEPGTAFPWVAFVLALVGAMALHTSANTFNDYFDWTSGTDKANNDYFLPFSGGSRSLELGLIKEKGLLNLAITALVIGAACGITLIALQGMSIVPGIFAFGAIAAFSVFFYTAPPLRPVARKGMGELLIGLNFGPLMTAGTVYALTGRVGVLDFLVGLPIGLLVTAILWINQFPDAESDAATGKNHLVVVLGKERARWGYAAIVFGAFIIVLAASLSNLFPMGALAMLLLLPVAVYTTVILFRHYQDRSLVRANSGTIAMHALAGIVMAAGLLLF